FVFVSFTEARIPTPPLLHDPPNQAIKNHQKSSHQLIVFVLLRMLEEMLDDRLMTTAIQRLRQVTENLPPRPRTGILFPAIGKTGEKLLRLNLPERFDEPFVLCIEILVQQQRKRSVVGTCGHDAILRN